MEKGIKFLKKKFLDTVMELKMVHELKKCYEAEEVTAFLKMFLGYKTGLKFPVVETDLACEALCD